MSDSNLSTFKYWIETTAGETPNAPGQILRTTGGMVLPQQDTEESGELRPDLRRAGIVRVGQMVQGSGIPFELSYDTFNDIFRGMLLADWQADTPAVGSERLEDDTDDVTFTFEAEMLGMTTPVYIGGRGCIITGLNLSIATQAIVTGTFDFVGRLPYQATTPGGDGTTAATTTQQFNSTDLVEEISVGGSPASDMVGMEISISRGSPDPKWTIGNLNPQGFQKSSLNVQVSVERYFEDNSFLESYLAFGERQLGVTFADEATNNLVLNFPRALPDDGYDLSRGRDEFALESVPFVGEGDDTTPMVQITKTDAT